MSFFPLCWGARDEATRDIEEGTGTPLIIYWVSRRYLDFWQFLYHLGTFTTSSFLCQFVGRDPPEYFYFVTVGTYLTTKHFFLSTAYAGNCILVGNGSSTRRDPCGTHPRCKLAVEMFSHMNTSVIAYDLHVCAEMLVSSTALMAAHLTTQSLLFALGI